MIVHTSFSHGWFYHYRHHAPKTTQLCTGIFSPLGAFLEKVHKDCPDNFFHEGPRGSKLKVKLPVDMHHVRGHEVCSLAALGHQLVQGKTAHTRVQLTMLERDEKTVAVELPLWMEASEMERFEDFFGTDKALSGHVDVLRMEEGRVWIWDYKPKAAKEKYAATQVYFYALMLSKRTGIPLDHVFCGYFDEQDAYIFKPALSQYLTML